jgi:hypothetical protein
MNGKDKDNSSDAANDTKACSLLVISLSDDLSLLLPVCIQIFNTSQTSHQK